MGFCGLTYLGLESPSLNNSLNSQAKEMENINFFLKQVPSLLKKKIRTYGFKAKNVVLRVQTLSCSFISSYSLELMVNKENDSFLENF